MEDLTFDSDGLPFSPRYGDHYYSRHDGQAETIHVFLGGNGLPDRWMGRDHFAIGELGFGTGLNVLETWRCWQETRTAGQHLSITSLDAHPLTHHAAEKALARWITLVPLAARLLDVWDGLADGVMLDEQTELRVVAAEAGEAITHFPDRIDAWYLDGFSPANNPAMWSAELMAALAQRTTRDGTFASYTAAGWVRRNLEQAGFTVARKPGYGTKRHMITGYLT